MREQILIKRFKENPLLEPKDVPWVNKYPEKERAVLNCGVIFDKASKEYKMLFRGGAGPFSDLGLATSKDGKKWQVYPEPVLRHTDNNYWDSNCQLGIEDPRIVRWIDSAYYVFTTICSGSSIKERLARVGIWKTLDFFKYELVSIPFDWKDKDASIIPEAINGWVYLIHRRDPDMWISRTQDLTLKSGWQDHQILISASDAYSSPLSRVPSWKIGLAGPPIKTPKGWLVIIHVVHKEKNKYNRAYSLGFVILDLKNPTKISYLHPAPILWPGKPYETKGTVPVVCFSCANIERNKDILIYWGGADTVICGGTLSKKNLPMCY